jgi:serine/threonine protein kinase
MQKLSVEQRFDRYTIVRLLGKGISGESYEAEDMLLQRKVTLKLIHPWSPPSDAARRQFFRSLQGMSFITHRSLAAILDYGEVNRQLYVARQYSVPNRLCLSVTRSPTFCGSRKRCMRFTPMDMHMVQSPSQIS